MKKRIKAVIVAIIICIICILPSYAYNAQILYDTNGNVIGKDYGGQWIDGSVTGQETGRDGIYYNVVVFDLINSFGEQDANAPWHMFVGDGNFWRKVNGSDMGGGPINYTTILPENRNRIHWLAVSDGSLANGTKVSEYFDHIGWKYCTMINYVDVNPTCTTNGSGHKSCAECGYTQYYTIPATGHSSTTKLVSNATCTTPAIYHDTCDRCGAETRGNYYSGTRLGHIWNEGQITKEPTVYETGIRHFTCLRDGNHQVDMPEPKLRFTIFIGDQRLEAANMNGQKIYRIYKGDTLLVESTGTAQKPAV